MKAGEFIARSTYCIFARAEKKPCSNCGWKHQCKCYYASPPSLSDWLRTSRPLSLSDWLRTSQPAQRQSRPVSYWLGSIMWPDCLHQPKLPSELLYEIIPTPFGDFEVWQALQEYIECLQPTFATPAIHPGAWGSWAPRVSVSVDSNWQRFVGSGCLTHTFICSVSFRLCATSQFVTSAAHHTGTQTAFPIVVSQSLITSAVSCWDNLCGKDVTESD